MRNIRNLAFVALFGAIMFGVIGCSQANRTTTTTEPKPALGVVKVGDAAPDFDLRNQEQIKISLSEFKGKKNVVLVFYPADFTPV